jgi:uncharacterized membrane protein YphA (DoxX/SURF4 family)
MASSLGSRPKVIGLWALKILFGVAFIAFGSFKLMGSPMMVQEFGVVGLGQWFRLFAGACEVGGALLMLVPQTTRVGAPILLCVSIGALIAQATRLHGDVIHTFVFIAATGFISWQAWTAKPASAAA